MNNHFLVFKMNSSLLVVPVSLKVAHGDQCLPFLSTYTSGELCERTQPITGIALNTNYNCYMYSKIHYQSYSKCYRQITKITELWETYQRRTINKSQSKKTVFVFYSTSTPCTENMAFLGVILGCMFAEKTTEMLRQGRMEQLLGKSLAVIVPDLDTRVSSAVYTHSQGDATGVTPVIVPHTDLGSYAATVEEDVIAIDEAQFFTDLVAGVKVMLSRGKTVWVAGLSGDYLQRPIGDVLSLIPLADNVVYLRALCLLCKDGTRASFTRRLDGSEETINIGAADKYMAVCRKHLGI